jgi:hypothetical protein
MMECVVHLNNVRKKSSADSTIVMEVNVATMRGNRLVYKMIAVKENRSHKL